MHFSALLSLVVAVVGLLIWFLTVDQTKLSQAGKLAYFAGLFVFLMQFEKMIGT